jgi:hypothetical protein
MKLSALRTKLALRDASLHVRAHQFREVNLLSYLHNSMSLRTTPLPMSSRISEQLTKPTDFHPLPACRVYLRDGTGGLITSREKRELTNEFTE